MLSLKSQVGKNSEFYSEEVSLDRIKSFCQAVGAPQSEFAPPTFLTVFRKGEFELFQKLDILLSQILHSEQEYQYENPIFPGDQVFFRTVVSNVLEKRGRSSSIQFVTFETEMMAKRQLENLHVGKSKTTIVIRHIDSPQ